MPTFPQKIDSRRKWLCFRCEIRAMTTNNSISRLLNHTGWSAWCNEVKLCCVFYNMPCVRKVFIHFHNKKKYTLQKWEKNYILCVHQWLTVINVELASIIVWAIGVNNWERTYLKNLCDMAACYRLRTTVEFYAKVAEELLIFLSHMSSDNFTS
jgi:uncharacterized protein (DUF2132 family)